MLLSTTPRLLTLVIGVTGMLAAGCSGSTPRNGSPASQVSATPEVPSATSSPPPASPTPASTSPTGSPTAGASAPVAAPVGLRCQASELAARLTSNGNGAGSSFLRLTLTDRGTRTCALTGFPGISYVAGADAHQVGAAGVRSTGSAQPTVQLAPGASGVAMIRSGNPNIYPPEQCRPVPVRGLRVYPPGSTASLVLELPAGTQACSASGLPGGPELEVGPVQRP